MAIKVQVKETGSTKTQSNMFSNGATFASNSYDFVGVQPAAINGLNAMNGFVSANAMNPFVTPLAFPNMPYARQNTIFGQLPGVGQQTLPCSGMMTTPAALNPMFAATANTAIAAHPLNAMGLNAAWTAPVNTTWAPTNLSTTVPTATALPVDIFDDGSQYLVTADLPGVKIDDIELTVENGVLTVKAIAEATSFVPGLEVAIPTATLIREKAPVKILQRSLVIGRDIAVENITAVITNGILTISLPKIAVMNTVPSRMSSNAVTAVA